MKQYSAVAKLTVHSTSIGKHDIVYEHGILSIYGRIHTHTGLELLLTHS